MAIRGGFQRAVDGGDWYSRAECIGITGGGSGGGWVAGGNMAGEGRIAGDHLILFRFAGRSHREKFDGRNKSDEQLGRLLIYSSRQLERLIDPFVLGTRLKVSAL